MSLCPVCAQAEPLLLCRALLYPGCEREIHECPACGAAYFWPVPSPEDVSRCYPHAYFRDFFKNYWKDYYKGRSIARTLTRFRKEGTFVDVGCALGTMAAGVRDFSRWSVRGLEYSPGAAAMGRALNKVEIEEGSIAAAPWPASSADFIHMNNVLEHEREPRAALEAAARLLKPGGRLLLTLPNGPVDLLPTRTLFRRWRRAVATRHGGHLFYFSRKSIARLLERCGLRPLSIRNFHFKMGLKARGWTPGAYKAFRQSPAPFDAQAYAKDQLPLEEYRKLIPPPPVWAAYFLSQKFRRLWRWRGLSWGYDL
ncbi:MAG TPA: class I SAM-dependent methyltransferase, partial [Elusimicrobiota bacterium]|nr:class I SAM-dependent methyltransferase [Elusimicrobiota bacterium]